MGNQMASLGRKFLAPLIKLSFSFDARASNHSWLKWLGDGMSKKATRGKETKSGKRVGIEIDRKWNICDHSVIVPIKAHTDNASDCKYWIKFHSKLITSNWSLRASCRKREREHHIITSQSHYRGWVCVCVFVFARCIHKHMFAYMHTTVLTHCHHANVFLLIKYTYSSSLIAKRVHWHIMFNQHSKSVLMLT